MVGRRIGHYKVIDVLGEGGMGIVYKAFDVKLERFVALKILNSQALNTPQFVERFKREAKNQAKLNHPNIVPVYGFTEENQVLGIVMEYVEGETLEELIVRKGRLGVLEALKLLQHILNGASFAHLKGFVHRDMKPSNIIINNEEVAKIMDFGISKSMTETKGITRIGTKLGTVLYMSPEQIKALEPTHQSDIYSIGITFYEMLTGKNPFDIGTDYQIMEAHLKMNPPRLSTMVGNVGTEVDDIIAHAMNKSTKKRYQSCEEFLIDVEKLIERIENPMAKTKAKTKIKTNPTITGKTKEKEFNGQKISVLKFYTFAFFFLIMFTGLILFIYDAVSGYWKEDRSTVSVDIDDANKIGIGYTKISGWKPTVSSTHNQINSLFFLNDSLGYACGLKGTFLKSTDAGETWVSLIDTSNELSSINFYDLHFTSLTSGFIAGDKGNLISYNAALNEFTKLNITTSESLFDINFIDETGTGFIVGANGTILKTNDTGYTWDRIPSSNHQLLYEVNFVNEKTGYIAGWNGTILKTTDHGNSWIKLDKVSDKYLRSIYFVDGEIGFTVGGGGEIFRTSNGGDDWEIIKSGTISGLYRVHFFDDSNGIILGSKGEVLVSDDLGKSWKLTSSGQFAGLINLAVTPAKKIFLSGQNGIILTSVN